jgi:Fic family protein
LIRLLSDDDTIMKKINQRQQKIIRILISSKMQSSDVHKALVLGGDDISLITVKRALFEMAEQGLLIVSGSGPATAYTPSSLGHLFFDIDAEEYFVVEPDKRPGLKSYNFSLFSELPESIFNQSELMKLNSATEEFRKRTADLSDAIQKKELERLIIELSWKSSRIEGNTYTLLDTEKLILENKEAVGHSHEEAVMILNHKEAFTYVYNNRKEFLTLNERNLDQLHKILVKDLSINFGLRKKAVGVTGSVYRPLDNVYQIREAVESLSQAVSKMSTAYDKALISLLGISYIQPFEDGNKRVARLTANAILMAYGHSALSYRSVDEDQYRMAKLVFYELNSILAFKKIFIEQYLFAAKNYGVK